jgi:glycosyltransferase involved in cell wall biosynthesis
VNVRHLRSELELDDMVELTGQLTGDAKWDAYYNADVFFFPTHYESEATPIVLMEALGTGLPIISTQWAGIPAMLKGCETAFLLPVRSPNEYADALTRIRTQRHEQAKTSETSRAFYREHFLPDRFIERVKMAFVAAGKPEHQLPAAGEPVLQSPTARCFGESVIGERKAEREACDSSSPTDIPKHRNTEAPPSPTDPPVYRNTETPAIRITAYLADQNPGHDRSFGISRMSQVVLDTLQTGGKVRIEAITSRTSQHAPENVHSIQILPWGTRRKWVRLLTDHFHPFFTRTGPAPEIYYFPKGYLPLLNGLCTPSVVTIHDTIIQYDEDHYPKWRRHWEYAYWARMLKHTLRRADRILTVSESSKRQIHVFMDRHQIPRKPITVTYEPCLYETLPQPVEPAKENYVIHLASCEPHKRTAHLIRWWHQAETEKRNLPALHLIGTVPPEVASLLTSARTIVKRPFLEDSALLDAYLKARALILPSEIEGFGLPALEAYYLGTPVCFVGKTSVEEILGVVTNKGRFSLEDPESLFSALDEVLRMSPEEVRTCGLKLREIYAAEKVAERMVSVFRDVKTREGADAAPRPLVANGVR